MHRRLCGIVLLSALFFLSACGLGQSPVTTVIVPNIIKETQIIEQTRIVQVIKIATVEVTRIVQQTVVVTPVPPPELLVNQVGWIELPLPRAQHTATLLSDGRVLLVGGSKSPNEQLADVEIFDPLTGTTIQASPLNTPRHDHTATLLLDGRVLVVGGYNHQQQLLGDSEVYDPSTNVWTVVPMLSSHGVQHTATLLKDGRVLVVGGAVGSNQITDQVDIFDPQTDSWYAAMPLESGRASHTAQLLDDGRVLVAGGGSATGIPTGGDALVYDPQTDSWTATGPMIYPRINASSVRLMDGRVLVVGGINLEDTLQGNPPLPASASAEIYLPASNSWEATADLSQARYGQVMLLLPDGRVLVGGGAHVWNCCWTYDSYGHEIEVYDPGTGLWDNVEKLPQVGVYSAAVFLPDGRVMITGGETGENGTNFLSDVWFYTP